MRNTKKVTNSDTCCRMYVGEFRPHGLYVACRTCAQPDTRTATDTCSGVPSSINTTMAVKMSLRTNSSTSHHLRANPTRERLAAAHGGKNYGTDLPKGLHDRFSDLR